MLEGVTPVRDRPRPPLPRHTDPQGLSARVLRLVLFRDRTAFGRCPTRRTVDETRNDVKN